MINRLARAAVATGVLLSPLPLRAQNDAAAAAAALILTPVAGLTPMSPALDPSTKQPEYGFQLRYGSWQPAGGSNRLHSVAAGLVMLRGATRTNFELGYSHAFSCSGCNGLLMAGADMSVPVMERASAGEPTYRIALNPAIGFGRSDNSADEGSALAAALNVPFSLSFAAGERTQLTPFLTPGGGYGRISGGGGAAVDGMRAMIAGGVTLAMKNSPVKWTASFRQIFVDNSRTVFGIGFSTR